MSAPLKEYLILTSKDSKKILAAEEIKDTYDFVRENPDTKFRTMDYQAKPSVISKTEFLERFFKETKDQARLFELVDTLLPRYSNATYFLSGIKAGRTLVDQYRKFKQLTDKHL